MTRRPLLSLMIFVLFAQPILLFAQDNSMGNWSDVKTLSLGQSLRIDTKSKKRFEGVVNSVNDSSITVLREGKTESIGRSDVRKLWTIRKGSMGKSVAIGAGVGAGAGAGASGILLAATGGSDSTSEIIAIGVAIGAGIGAALGAAAGARKRTLVYESK